ncbi:glucose-6-phosphate dehydrogenase assembly protein OpcA [Amnibacterium endophyticum]|uniref:Glucose-6-phosphate dehydrogenase assembly protein OpcA n=1 Tax=Amnibacterium endophyticum TaxID=2109337 RepID=A0ABW4LD49_9MICO
MIVDLPDTTTAEVSRALVDVRNEGGAVALGRVLTLIISTTSGTEEEAIQAANDASREHPMRVVAVVRDDPAGAPRLDAQIRVGGDAGASEVIVLRAAGPAGADEEGLVTGLLLPDAPVVAWWPGTDTPSVVAESPLGRIAQRRITDAAAHPDPQETVDRLAETYRPGDTDLAWTRLTLWRAVLAATLDQAPYEPVESVEVSGAVDSASTELLAAWLGLALQVPVSVVLSDRSTGSSGIHGVRMRRASGEIHLERAVPDVATLTQPDQPVHDVSLPRRSLRDCLAEELRRQGPDDLYGDVLTRGLAALDRGPATGAGGA